MRYAQPSELSFAANLLIETRVQSECIFDPSVVREPPKIYDNTVRHVIPATSEYPDKLCRPAYVGFREGCYRVRYVSRNLKIVLRTLMCPLNSIARERSVLLILFTLRGDV